MRWRTRDYRRDRIILLAIAANPPAGQRSEASTQASPNERRPASVHRCEHRVLVVAGNGIREEKACRETNHSAGPDGVPFDPGPVVGCALG